MSNKSKGSKYERELLQIFTDHSWRAARVAGSGTNDNTFCDLIAGKFGEAYAVEAKSSRSPRIYITKEQINDFLQFTHVMGLTPVIAARFSREGWFFLKPEQLEDSGKKWVVNLENIRDKALRFGQFFKENSEEII